LSLSPSLPPSLSPTCRSLMGIRSGATLMFPGIFLGLVGMTFTDMGWLKYSVSCRGTFILISICKFRMLSCRACKQSDYDKDLSELLEIPGSGQSFVFNGINQPIMFHGATVGQYIPALYRSVTQEVNLANGLQPMGFPETYMNESTDQGRPVSKCICFLFQPGLRGRRNIVN
uniref:Transmembrane protein 174 n=1 Tax=Oncorhynchus tshawytscha TaxID=74940 RepID=A0A8C8F137_ONCTS